MSLVDKYMEYVKPLKGSKRYHRWSFLTIVSAIMERRIWLDRGRLGILFPNMYTILVGPPAAGKSTAAQLAADMIKEILIEARPRIRVGPTKITQAALYKELKDAERMYVIPGVGDCRSSPVFLYASELAINLTDFGGGTLTNELIDFYDSKGLKAEMQKRLVADKDPMTLLNPSITLLGCTTDEFLQSAAQDKLVTSGLSSRIMFVVEPNRVQKQRNHVDVDQDAYKEIINALIGVYRMSGAMKFDQLAYKRYVEIADKADDNCFETHGAFHQNYYGRKPDHVTKVAMTLAAMRGSYDVSVEDVETALEYIVAVEPDMIKAFGVRNIDNDSALSQHIENAIPVWPDKHTLTQIYATLRKDGKFLSTDLIVANTIEGMIMNGQVERITIGATTYYARPKPDQIITPIA